MEIVDVEKKTEALLDSFKKEIDEFQAEAFKNAPQDEDDFVESWILRFQEMLKKYGNIRVAVKKGMIARRLFSGRRIKHEKFNY